MFLTWSWREAGNVTNATKYQNIFNLCIFLFVKFINVWNYKFVDEKPNRWTQWNNDLVLTSVKLKWKAADWEKPWKLSTRFQVSLDLVRGADVIKLIIKYKQTIFATSKETYKHVHPSQIVIYGWTHKEKALKLCSGSRQGRRSCSF